LLEKLICYGFEKSAIEWFQNYLANREFTVTFNGTDSDIQTLDCGVPQGSCLGPILFSIFTNDLPFVLENSTMALYADDSTIE